MANIDHPLRRMLRRSAAATYCGVSDRKFDAMVADDTLPKARLLGSVRVWDRRDLDAALDDLPLADRPNEWDAA